MQCRETQITMVKWTNAGGQTKRANERSFVYRPAAWRRWRNVKTTYYFLSLSYFVLAWTSASRLTNLPKHITFSMTFHDQQLNSMTYEIFILKFHDLLGFLWSVSMLLSLYRLHLGSVQLSLHTCSLFSLGTISAQSRERNSFCKKASSCSRNFGLCTPLGINSFVCLACPGFRSGALGPRACAGHVSKVPARVSI